MIARLRSWDTLTAVAVLVIAVAAVQLLAGALEVGVTTDEPRHTERAIGWIEDGYYMPQEFLIDGEPDPGNEFASPYVYGPTFSAIAHLANVAAGNEALDEISSTADAYRVRHLIVALLALLGAAAAGVAVWQLTRSGILGLWATAALLALPRWLGHGFFNLKDIPAATGYTLVTLALVLALLDEPGRPASRQRKIWIGATMAAGICIGAGTRLSLWVPMLASLLGYAALRAGQRYLGGVVRDRGADIAIVAGAAGGALAIAALYPKVASRPFTLLVESVANSSDYPYGGYTLTAGSLLHENPPAWYLPAWVGGTVPVLLAALTLLGGIAVVAALIGVARRGGARAFWGDRRLGSLLVLQQALLLPVVAVVGGAVMYSGLRQHLYMLPALAILAGLGAAQLRRLAADGMRRALATVVLGLALIVPMAEQTLLFPYNYTYVNPVAGIGGVDDRWETDYWFASAPEAISRVPRDAELRCSGFLVPGWAPQDDADVERCEGDQFEPFLSEQGDDALAVRPGEKATWLIARKRAANLAPAYCEEAGNVTRWVRGEDVTMAFVLRCDPQQIRKASR